MFCSRECRAVRLAIGLAFGLLLAVSTRVYGGENAWLPLRLVELPHVRGRIDHLAYDEKTHRVFIAALGNNTVEVVDLKEGKHLQSLAGFEEPQGICFLSDLRKLVVASGGDGSCRIYGGETLKLEQTIDLKSDADNVHYDDASKRLYVGHGDGAIAVIDPASGKVLADIKLSAHPEGFAIDAAAKRVYVNVPNSHQVEVIDLDKGEVIDRWKLKASSNYPMALDAANHRLLIGCRSPAQLEMIDTATGKVTASVKCVGDVDDVFFSQDGTQVFAIGGEGAVDAFAIDAAGKAEKKASIPTQNGARTALLLPDGKHLLIAAPSSGDQGASVRVLDKLTASEIEQVGNDLEKVRKDSATR